jgi:hypothetical protein
MIWVLCTWLGCTPTPEVGETDEVIPEADEDDVDDEEEFIEHEACTEALAIDTGTMAPSMATDVVDFFDDCISCHRSNITGLLFNNPYEELVDVPSFEVVEMDRVEPFDPDQSYLWHKLCGTHQVIGGGGDQMPINKKVKQKDLRLIRQWIALGAQP